MVFSRYVKVSAKKRVFSVEIWEIPEAQGGLAAASFPTTPGGSWLWYNGNSSGEKLVDIRVFHKTDLALFCKNETLRDNNTLSTVLFCVNLNQKMEVL